MSGNIFTHMSVIRDGMTKSLAQLILLSRAPTHGLFTGLDFLTMELPWNCLNSYVLTLVIKSESFGSPKMKCALSSMTLRSNVASLPVYWSKQSQACSDS